MVEKNLIDPKVFAQNQVKLQEVSTLSKNSLTLFCRQFHELHTKKYIQHLEKENANMKLEVT